MEKHSYIGKNLDEAINKATIDLQELKENLLIIIKEEKKTLLSKKVEIEVIEKREAKEYLKEIIETVLKDIGFQVNIEIQMHHDVPIYHLYSNNDALLIGKNGKNLAALTIVINQIIKNKLGTNYRFIIDVSDYKEKNEKHLEILAKNLAREVADTKIEVTMDSMNSYERRIVHNALTNHKYVYTESIGEEPNRRVVIKPRSS